MRFRENSTARAAIDPIAGHDEILGESVKKARALDDRSPAGMHARLHRNASSVVGDLPRVMAHQIKRDRSPQ
jgi:hypothetical protein